MEDYSDTLGAGSYPEPAEPKEKNVSAEITITFNINTTVPQDWEDDDIKRDIKENLKDYIDICDYRDLDVDLNWIGES